MPTVTFALDLTGQPIIELYIGISAIERETFVAPEQPPPPRLVRALADTGAARTVMDRHSVEALRTRPIATTRLFSVTTGAVPAPSLTYAVSVALAGERTGVLATDLEVVAVDDLSGLGVQALLGRDILNDCLFYYDGPAREFTLTFPPFGEP